MRRYAAMQCLSTSTLIYTVYNFPNFFKTPLITDSVNGLIVDMRKSVSLELFFYLKIFRENIKKENAKYCFVIKTPKSNNIT